MMDYIRSFLTLIFAISMMYTFLDCDISKMNKRILLGLFVAAVIAGDTFVIINLGYWKFMQLYPLIVQLPVLLGFIFISRFKAIKVFFIHLTFIAITSSFILLGFVISLAFDASASTVDIVCYILYLPIWFVIYKFIRPTFLYMLRNTERGWFGFCTIPLTFAALAYFVTKYKMDILALKQVITYSILVFILTFASYALILRFFKQTREHYVIQNMQEVLKLQMSATQSQLEAVKESEEKAIVYRHDLRHHLNLIDAYLTANDIDHAREYITDIKSDLNQTIKEKYCENKTVNLILSSYINKAKAECIKVESQVSLPQKIAIGDMDICVILANALENAITACKDVADIEHRIMSIICKENQGKLLIQTSNSFTGEIEFVNEIPQSHQEQHGYGVKSIISIVEKYSGIYSFTVENDMFKTSVII